MRKFKNPSAEIHRNPEGADGGFGAAATLKNAPLDSSRAPATDRKRPFTPFRIPESIARRPIKCQLSGQQRAKAAGTAAVRNSPRLPAPMPPASRWPCPPIRQGNIDAQDTANNPAHPVYPCLPCLCGRNRRQCGGETVNAAAPETLVLGNNTAQWESPCPHRKHQITASLRHRSQHQQGQASVSRRPLSLSEQPFCCCMRRNSTFWSGPRGCLWTLSCSPGLPS